MDGVVNDGVGRRLHSATADVKQVLPNTPCWSPVLMAVHGSEHDPPTPSLRCARRGWARRTKKPSRPRTGAVGPVPGGAAVARRPDTNRRAVPSRLARAMRAQALA